jgi:anti-sigma factor RsiW
MKMHLYGEILERYVDGDLPRPTLAAIDAHVSNCLVCAHVLANDSADSARWERRGWLGRLVRVETAVVVETEREELRSAA